MELMSANRPPWGKVGDTACALQYNSRVPDDDTKILRCMNGRLDIHLFCGSVLWKHTTGGYKDGPHWQMPSSGSKELTGVGSRDGSVYGYRGVTTYG